MDPLRLILALALISGGIIFSSSQALAIGETYPDTDGDGWPDNMDPWPNDPNKPTKSEDDPTGAIGDAIEWLIDIKGRLDDIWGIISNIPGYIVNGILGILNFFVSLIEGAFQIFTDSWDNWAQRETGKTPLGNSVGVIATVVFILFWFLVINVLVRIWSWVNFIIPT